MLTDKSLKIWRPTDTTESSRDVWGPADSATGVKPLLTRKGDTIPLRKKSDRDGLYAVMSEQGTISFRYDYKVGTRRETLTVGRYDAQAPAKAPRELEELQYGMTVTLAEARLLLTRARRSVEKGESPSRAKAEQKAATAEARNFGAWAEAYFQHKADPKSKGEQLADSTLARRRSTYRRTLEQPFGRLMLQEITPARLSALCDELKEKRGPAVAIHAREIVLMVFRFAQAKGMDIGNPAERVQASSIATLEPRDRALTPTELRLFLQAVEGVATLPTLRLALRFVLLTGVRKGEFIGATWDEIDWDAETWTIPAARMKAGKVHVVYLSRQAMDILETFQACFSASRYLHPGRYESDITISNATLNRVIAAAIERIRKDQPDFQAFSVHDLRRTFSTLLNAAKFDSRFIEMSLAHAPRDRIAATYNVAQFAGERRIMLQAWADMIDCWVAGESARDVIAQAKVMVANVNDDLELGQEL